MSKENIDLSIIIVSYNTQKYIGDAIQSAIESCEGKLKYELLVVENHSQDDSFSYLAKTFPQLKIIQTERTVGFGEANNLGAQIAQGKYLLFLNPDTITHADAVPQLVSHLKNHPNCGIVAPRLLNADGSIQTHGGALPTPLNLFIWGYGLSSLFRNTSIPLYQSKNTALFMSTHTTGWVGGTALCISAEDFHALGGFDQKIFLYAEDLELCWNLQARLKKTVQVLATSRITHLQNKSTGSNIRSLVGELTNMPYVLRKHKPHWPQWLVKIVLMDIAVLRSLGFAILRRDVKRSLAYLKAAQAVLMA